MEEIIKIEPINLPKLNLAEYGNFINRTIYYIEETGIANLYISAEVLASFKANLALATEIQSNTRRSLKTIEMNRLHRERNRLLVYCFRFVRIQRGSPFPACREAAEHLYPMLRECKSSKRIPHLQQSVQISALLQDLEKPENAPLVTTLGMQEAFDQLREANEAYNRTEAERRHEQVTKKQIPAKPVREEMDRQYDYCMSKAFAAHCLHPTTESEWFVTNINQWIHNTNAAYHLRKSVSASWKKRKNKGESEEKTTE